MRAGTNDLIATECQHYRATPTEQDPQPNVLMERNFRKYLASNQIRGPWLE